ncbi:ankyrin [Mollisia scopiformis]|uniref:Ankyrin n=1 Tax=Mollisia scopiformis TaxID=149040 RepID=A0A194WYH4_MOLSC|nr:ankyrin [Mollisia scopiformis]KUJ13016.1 ankyrin [Mollisia scopiformis]
MTIVDPAAHILRAFQAVKDVILFEYYNPNSPWRIRKRAAGYEKGWPRPKFSDTGIDTLDPPIVKARCDNDLEVVDELVKRKEEDCVRALLRLGADVNLVDYNGMTALRGANVDAVHSIGRPPIHLAVIDGSIDSIKVLVEVEANLSCIQPTTAQMTSLSYGTFDDLLGMPTRLYHTKDGEPVLGIAVQYNSPDVVNYLLQNGCSSKDRNNKGLTALHHVAMTCPILPPLPQSTLSSIRVCRDGCQHVAIGLLLLRSDADIDAKDDFGITPLQCAVSRKCPRMIKMLLEQKSKIYKAKTRRFSLSPQSLVL